MSHTSWAAVPQDGDNGAQLSGPRENGTDYGPSQMSYDPRRLRLHGLIQRLAHSNTYTVTPNGIRVAVFYTKLHGRLLAPLLVADRPPATLEMRRALATIDRTIADCVANSRLGAAA